MNGSNIIEAYIQVFGLDPLLQAYLASATESELLLKIQDLSNFTSAHSQFWLKDTPFSGDPDVANSNVIYLDDGVKNAYEGAFLLRAELLNALGKMRASTFRGAFIAAIGDDVESFEQIRGAQIAAHKAAAIALREMVVTAASVLDIVDIGLILNEYAEGDAGIVHVALASIPFIPVRVIRTGGKVIIPGSVIATLSTDMGKALTAAGVVSKFPVESRAHHIFPVHLWGTELGERLRNWDIDLNGTDNGMWLPFEDFNRRVAPLHRGRHTDEYRDVVYRLLNAATTTEEAIAMLADIKSKLEQGLLGL